MSQAQLGAEDSFPELDAPLGAHAAFRIALPNFEGPLDLLLHLIREHKLDIFDIPIALISEKYLEHLEAMREINLDIAGEFLVMAATLAHIKSRLLLPRPELQGDTEQEEPGDPRAELVRRLLEYQKYKAAAETFARRDILDRDVFTRRARMERLPLPPDDVGLVEVSVYKLIEALDRALKNASPEVQHEVIRERLSITDAIHSLVARLKKEGQITFWSVFDGEWQAQRIVATFLAVLEMCRLKLIRIHQSDADQEIVISPKGEALQDVEALEVDDEYE